MLGSVGGGFQTRRHSEDTAREIDCAVRKIVDSAYNRAIKILAANRGLLEEGSKQLLEKETLPEQDLKALFSRVQSIGGETNQTAETMA
jgi:cell division protease FtsH